MKEKKRIFWIVLIIAVLLVTIGGLYAFTRSPESAQEKTQKASTVQSSSKMSAKKVEAKVSKPSTDSSMSESTAQASQTKNSISQSKTQGSKVDLNAFNQKAASEEIYVKYPYGRDMNFERATVEKLESLEKKYTLKGTSILKDNYDGQSKPVIVFE